MNYLLSCFTVVCVGIYTSHVCHAQHYVDKFAVHIEGGPQVAKDLAEKHGFIYLDQVRLDYI